MREGLNGSCFPRVLRQSSLVSYTVMGLLLGWCLSLPYFGEATYDSWLLVTISWVGLETRCCKRSGVVVPTSDLRWSLLLFIIEDPFKNWSLCNLFFVIGSVCWVGDFTFLSNLLRVSRLNLRVQLGERTLFSLYKKLPNLFRLCFYF